MIKSLISEINDVVNAKLKVFRKSFERWVLTKIFEHRRIIISSTEPDATDLPDGVIWLDSSTP